MPPRPAPRAPALRTPLVMFAEAMYVLNTARVTRKHAFSFPSTFHPASAIPGLDSQTRASFLRQRGASIVDLVHCHQDPNTQRDRARLPRTVSPARGAKLALTSTRFSLALLLPRAAKSSAIQPPDHLLLLFLKRARNGGERPQRRRVVIGGGGPNNGGGAAPHPISRAPRARDA